MGEFKPIETQEELDAIIQARLSKQKASYEAKLEKFSEIESENTSLKEELASSKAALEGFESEKQGFSTQIEELTGKVKNYELRDLKTTIALQNGIPYNLASRLAGDTEEAILADAKSLAAIIGSTESIAPLKSTEPGENVGGGYKELLGNLNLEGE